MKIIAVGKIKKEFVKEGINYFLKQLRKIEIIELKQTNIEEESDLILKTINKKDFNILLDINGKNLETMEFYNLIEEIENSSKNITFIIGGSCGVLEKVKNVVDFRLSFSKMTFPHELFRLMLIEQIYRVFQIKENKPYHK